MPFLHNFNLIVLEREFEKGDYAIGHELGRNGSTAQAGKFLLNISNVLAGLHHADLIVATFCLLLTILRVNRSRPELTPFAVAAVITAGYWFTASTSFANPAITIARALSDTFAGIAPASVAAFIVAQLLGALAAWGCDLAFGHANSTPATAPRAAPTN